MAAEFGSVPSGDLHSQDHGCLATSPGSQDEVPEEAPVTHGVGPLQNSCSTASPENPPTSTLKLLPDLPENAPDVAETNTDNDPERPIREKLKKTSIGALSKNELDSNSHTETTRVPQKVVEEQLASPSALTDVHSPQPPGRDYHNVDNDHLRTAIQPEESNLQASNQMSNEKSERSKETSDEGGSRPITPNDAAEPSPMDEDPQSRVLSPRKKRSRDQFDKDLEKGPQSTEAIVDKERRRSEDADRENNSNHRLSRTARDEPEKKRHRDISEDSSLNKEGRVTKIPSDSGFANTSAVSPFGTLAQNLATSHSASKEDPKASAERPAQPSLSFATSGFASLAGATSLFGTLGASQPSVFGAAGKTDSSSQPSSGFRNLSLENTQATSPAFGGVSSMGISGFGSKGPAFGGLSSGGSSGFGIAGQGLRSFASEGGAGISGLSKGSAKPFGAPPTEDDEEHAESEDEEGDDEDGDPGAKDAKEDRRFHQREVETGEEGEHTLFSGRAKLFHFDSSAKAWKERGVGVLKLNASSGTGSRPENLEKELDTNEAEEQAPAENDGELKTFARLLMRSEGVYRVVLNVPVFKTMQAGDHHGDVPSDRCIKFTALEEGRPTMMQLRFGSNATAVELWHRIKEVQNDM